jgi:phage tail P2-like protein
MPQFLGGAIWYRDRNALDQVATTSTTSAGATVDIKPLLPEPIRRDEEATRIAEAASEPSFEPSKATVLRWHIDQASDPPHPVLDSLAVALDVDIWKPSWGKTEKRRVLRRSIQAHRNEGTPREIVRRIDRSDQKVVGLFERLTPTCYMRARTGKTFDDSQLDEEALDPFQVGPHINLDETIGEQEWWIAVRPGWGETKRRGRWARTVERLSPERLGVLVPSLSPANANTTATQGRYSDDGISIEAPGGAYGCSERANRGHWAWSAQVDLEVSAMQQDGVLVAVERDADNRYEVRRSGAGPDLELRALQNGTEKVSETFFLSDGWQYLTLRRDGDLIEALSGGVVLASGTFSGRAGPKWRPALGYRPSEGDRHANLVFSDQILWRSAPSDETLAGQARRNTHLAREQAGAWRALPSDR